MSDEDSIDHHAYRVAHIDPPAPKPAHGKELVELVQALGYHSEHPVTGKLVLTNPLGPAAADAIASLTAKVAELERERDEAMDHAHNWHGQCQSIAAILDLHEPECLGFAGEVRAKFEAAEARERAALEDLETALLSADPYPHVRRAQALLRKP